MSVVMDSNQTSDVAMSDDRNEKSVHSFILTQLCFASLMFIAIFGGFVAPFTLIIGRKRKSQSVDSRLDHRRDGTAYSQTTLSCCNCFAAGIFVAICFLGLVPVVRQEFKELFEKAKYENISYPVSELTILMGFFFVLFLEHFVVSCRSSECKPPTLHLDDCSSEQSYRLLDETSDSSSKKEIDTATKIESNFDVDKNGDLHSEMHSAHGHTHQMPDTANATGFGFFILVFATSIHSVFEGLALGLLKDIPKAVHLFIGIILHEVLVAFALGINAARVNTSLKSNVKFAIVFSLTVPIGILMGLGLGYTPGLLGKLISAVFQGLAAGTFLNVAFLDLMSSELSENSGSKNVNKLFKIILMFSGFLSMALLNLFTGND